MINYNNIPEMLKDKSVFVGFMVENGKKIPKVINSDGMMVNGRANAPSCCVGFNIARSWVDLDFVTHMGVLLQKENNIMCLDLDCHTDGLPDDKKAALEQQYEDLVKRCESLDTYSEKSVSGKGRHIFVKGAPLEGYKTGKSTKGCFELYYDKHFIALTGDTDGTTVISDNPEVLQFVHDLQREYFSPITPKWENGEGCVPIITKPIYTDEDVLKFAKNDKKFQLLWNNKWDEVLDENGERLYGAQHFSDFSLIKKLSFYTGNCPKQMEKMFKNSPTYKAYGFKNGKKYIKFDKDIENDIKSACKSCTKVFEKKDLQAQVETVAKGITAAPPSVPNTTNKGNHLYSTDEKTKVWKPNWDEINSVLCEEDKNAVFSNDYLLNILQDYVKKYKNSNIKYFQHLFDIDPNVNGFTAVIKTVAGNKLMYSKENETFYRWDGKKFVAYLDSDELVAIITDYLELVKHSIFRWVIEEVAFSPYADTLQDKAVKMFRECVKWVSVSNARNILAKYKGLSSNVGIKHYYDTDYLNMQNGMLNLKTLTLHPHDPIYGQDRITNCNYDPSSTCPHFNDMLDLILPDKDVRREFQKMVGLCLVKRQVPAKKILNILLGDTDVGKTTLSNIFKDVYGGYSTSIDKSVLMKSVNRENRGPDLLELKSALYIGTGETNEGDALDVAKIKALTGNTTISTKNNYAKKMDKFNMTGLIFIDSNFKPNIPINDTATWNRLRLIPFKITITKKDSNILEKLKHEKDGIFLWILEGMHLVEKEGEIYETAEMLKAKKEFMKSMDQLQQFREDCILVADKRENISTKIVFDCYKQWVKDNGLKLISRNKFYEEMAAIFEKRKSNTEKFYGIRFTDLGRLYANAQGKSISQFESEKKLILTSITPDTEDGTFGYKSLRRAYFKKSIAWFENIKSHLLNIEYARYFESYAIWCIENGCMPINKADFIVKVNYITKNIDHNQPSQALLNKAMDIWAD